jgi:murein DD-endopeptidase MepM/ murein hydrolase activator NlpD
MGRVAVPSPRLRRLLPLAAAALLATACASVPGELIHVVRPGENLYRISLHYGVPVERLIRENQIQDVSALAVGQSLRIPGARRGPADAQLVPSERGPTTASLDASALGLDFAWPVHGAVSSRFGSRGWSHHEGIDIPAHEGTTVLAAESGRVVHSEGRIGDYGNLVIVKHAGRYATIYAHNCRNLVHSGDFVEKGQAIAQVGETGNASGPHLHFEIRRDRLPQDPLLYLPHSESESLARQP